MTRAGRTSVGAAVVLASIIVILRATTGADAPRTIDVTLSRYAFSPERIEVRLGERVRLNVMSADRVHGFEVKELELNARIPAGGRAVSVELTPKETGTFEIKCSEYCGAGHSRMKAWLIVTPGS
jgi:cytochrome c oxidase subunit II